RAHPGGPSECAPRGDSIASSRRPHTRGFPGPESSGKAHDLPWLLDGSTYQSGAWCATCIGPGGHQPHPATQAAPNSRGGCTRGVSAERFETPSCGGSRPLLAAWGEPAPPRLAPGGGNGKGGEPNSLLPQAIGRD